MMDWDGISIDILLPHSKQGELAADKVKNSCFPGARRFISGNPTAQMTHRLVERSRKCQKKIKLLPLFHLSHHCTSANVEV